MRTKTAPDLHGPSARLFRGIGDEDAHHPARRAPGAAARRHGARFAQHRDTIEIVRKLADRLGMTAVDDFDDVSAAALPAYGLQVYPARCWTRSAST